MALLIWLASLAGTAAVGGSIVKGAVKAITSQLFVHALAVVMGLGFIIFVAELIFNPAFLQVFMTN